MIGQIKNILFEFKNIIISITIFILIFFAIEEFWHHEYLLFKSTSPNKSCTITVTFEGAFGFGFNKVHVYYKMKNGLIKYKLFSTEIFDDGGLLAESNYEISWSGDIAYITLKGEEQGDESFFINTKNKETLNKSKNMYSQ